MIKGEHTQIRDLDSLKKGLIDLTEARIRYNNDYLDYFSNSEIDFDERINDYLEGMPTVRARYESETKEQDKEVWFAEMLKDFSDWNKGLDNKIKQISLITDFNELVWFYITIKLDNVISSHDHEVTQTDSAKHMLSSVGLNEFSKSLIKEHLSDEQMCVMDFIDHLDINTVRLGPTLHQIIINKSLPKNAQYYQTLLDILQKNIELSVSTISAKYPADKLDALKVKEWQGTLAPQEMWTLAHYAKAKEKFDQLPDKAYFKKALYEILPHHSDIFYFGPVVPQSPHKSIVDLYEMTVNQLQLFLKFYDHINRTSSSGVEAIQDICKQQYVASKPQSKPKPKPKPGRGKSKNKGKGNNRKKGKQKGRQGGASAAAAAPSPLMEHSEASGSRVLDLTAMLLAEGVELPPSATRHSRASLSEGGAAACAAASAETAAAGEAIIPQFENLSLSDSRDISKPILEQFNDKRNHIKWTDLEGLLKKIDGTLRESKSGSNHFQVAIRGTENNAVAFINRRHRSGHLETHLSPLTIQAIGGALHVAGIFESHGIESLMIPTSTTRRLVRARS